MKIYCIAILRVCDPGIKDYELKDAYDTSFLSDFSRKARTKGTRDSSVLYAFDLEEMELVCSKCFSGNMLDATSYREFLSENRITRGIIVGDKWFPESAAHDHFEANPDLHYLNPVKRNSKLIGRHHMLDFTSILPGYEGITFRKKKYGQKEVKPSQRPYLQKLLSLKEGANVIARKGIKINLKVNLPTLLQSEGNTLRFVDIV